ncbi:hypothetical protein LUX57_20255 [Actinomadura madurae]|nr:hypothetical protein [Actinomadura madurae]MCP9967159.1 hypothetical protein [Actinomadura madurae]
MTLIVGAVMGQRSPSAADAVNTAEGILVAAERALVAKPLARRGDVVGRIDDGLDGSTALRATAPVAVVGWPGLTVRVGYDGDPPADAAPGDAARRHGRGPGAGAAGGGRAEGRAVHRQAADPPRLTAVRRTGPTGSGPAGPPGWRAAARPGWC